LVVATSKRLEPRGPGRPARWPGRSTWSAFIRRHEASSFSSGRGAWGGLRRAGAWPRDSLTGQAVIVGGTGAQNCRSCTVVRCKSLTVQLTPQTGPAKLHRASAGPACALAGGGGGRVGAHAARPGLPLHFLQWQASFALKPVLRNCPR
jgi:hypothetical protein